MTEIRFRFVKGDPQPEFRHKDVDGDELLITTAEIPGVGAGVYFRTSHDGSSVPFADVEALVGEIRRIADFAHADAERTSPHDQTPPEIS